MSKNILPELTDEVNSLLDRYGGIETLKAYSALDWMHFIANQLSRISRDYDEAGRFAERRGQTREALLRIAGLAVLGVTALDARNEERDVQQTKRLREKR